jgi:ABC-type glycerol-3-phosphate transport system substrate-binding protein
LYWNKDLFRNAGVVKVPADWESFVSVVPKLSILNESADITQSAIAFGEYQNVLNAKEILSALILQTGSKIVKKQGFFISDLISENQENNPTLALKFYMDFSNPVKNVYSWNKTFDRSREAFAANKVAMYAGFISEQEAIDALNPNLNYGIAVWPQSVRTSNKATYGRFLGVAILKNSRDPGAAYAAAAALASPDNVAVLSRATGMPAAQRNLLVEVPSDPFMSVGIQSARIAQTWLEPDAYQTDTFIKRAIESVSDGESSEDSIEILHEDLSAALSRYVAY